MPRKAVNLIRRCTALKAASSTAGSSTAGSSLTGRSRARHGETPRRHHQRLEAAEQRVGAVLELLIGHQLDAGGQRCQQLQDDLDLEPPERCAEAEMRSLSERQMQLGVLTIDHELVGIVE